MRTSIYDKASNLYNEGLLKKAYRKYKDGHLKNDFYCSLGMLKCLLLGYGVTKNKEEVILSIKQYEIELINRYERKEIEATYYLAFFLDEKIIVNDNYDVLSLVKNLVRKKHKWSILMLGKFYYYGKYVSEDIEKSKLYFKKSLEKGCLIAAAYLGSIYYDKNSYKRAFYYYNMLRNSEAPFPLSRISQCYYYGKGHNKNIEQAYYYCNKVSTLSYKLYLELKIEYFYIEKKYNLFSKFVNKLREYSVSDSNYWVLKYCSEVGGKSSIKWLETIIAECEGKIDDNSLFLPEKAEYEHLKNQCESILMDILVDIDALNFDKIFALFDNIYKKEYHFFYCVYFLDLISTVSISNTFQKKYEYYVHEMFNLYKDKEFTTIEEHYSWGKLNFLFGNYSEAIKILKNEVVNNANFCNNNLLKSSILTIGQIYSENLNNPEEAILWFEKNNINLFAPYCFEICLDDNNYSKANKYIKYMMNNNHLDGFNMYNLARFYLSQDYLNVKLAIKYLKSSYKKGNKRAAYLLADIYASNIYGVRDDNLAKKFFIKYEETKFMNPNDELQRYRDIGITLICDKNSIFYNKEKGIKILKKAISLNDSFSIFILGNYYYDNYDEKNALYWYSKGEIVDEIHCILMIAEIYCSDKFKNYSEALSKYLKIIRIVNDVNNNLKHIIDPYNILPEIYYKVGYLYYNNEDIPIDLSKSLDYFKKAKALGYNCDYAIEMVNSELGIENEDNFINKFARSIIYKQMNINNYPRIIEQEFSKDFSEEWNLLSKYSKDAIVVGMFNYLSCYSIEKGNQNLNIDYSSTINQFSKALEYETKNLFYSGYIKYLIENNISPELFEKKKGFTQNKNGQLILKEQYGGFTLGSLKHVIGVKKQTIINTDSSRVRITEKYVIDDTMLDYCDKVLFKQEAFSQINRRKEITHYLINLGNEVNDIVNFYRNPSAHCGKIMYRSKAETCGNWIIKGRKILKKLLEKVNTK